MNKNPTISVVTPVKNEEKTIGACLARMPRKVTEIVVVDNNSTDNTAQVAKEAGAKVLFEPKNANGIGYGFAHLRGLAAATGDFVCGMDGDDTYPSQEIPKIVNFMQEKNLDFVSCARLPLKNKKAISATRQLGIKVLNWEVQLLYGKKISDILSGMWILRREILPKLSLTEGGWNFSPEIKLAALNHPEIKFAECHIDHFARDDGASKQRIWLTGLKHLFYILRRRLSKDNLVFQKVANLFQTVLISKLKFQISNPNLKTVKLKFQVPKL
ncbi:MAG: glycosyltransferase family 2 protein [Candidatus Cloacimonetes bacterium]|nr:glycosyltransferase family 2 protein [Candidatus Cloacimonadota bacterium]